MDCRGQNGLEASVQLFDSHQDFLDYILAGYSLENLPSQPMPNGINQNTWQRFSDGSKYREAPKWMNGDNNTSFEDIFYRDKYNRLDDFNRIYQDELLPFILELYKDFESQALLEVPKIEYTSLETGIFSFDRASVEMTPKIDYFDCEKQESIEPKFVKKIDGLFFDNRNERQVYLIPKYSSIEKSIKACEFIKNGGKITQLITHPELRPEKFSSSVRKVYTEIQKKESPKKAVRMIVNVIHAWDMKTDECKWTGYAAFALDLFLRTLGYMTAIDAYMPWKPSNNLAQIISFQAKGFYELTDTSYMLYCLSDPALIRLKGHLALAKSCAEDNQRFYTEILDEKLAEFYIFRTLGAEKDKIWAKNIKHFTNDDTKMFLYASFRPVYDLDAAKAMIKEVLLEILNTNLRAIERIREEKNMP